MTAQPQEGEGCIRDAAAVLAIAGWSAGMFFVFPLLEWNRWMAVFVGVTVLGLYLLLGAVASRLQSAASAAFLARVEREKEASVGNELTEKQAAAAEEAWKALASETATTTSAPGAQDA